MNHVVHLQARAQIAWPAGPEVPGDHPNGMALPVLVGFLTLYRAGVTGFDGSWGVAARPPPAGLVRALRQEG